LNSIKEKCSPAETESICIDYLSGKQSNKPKNSNNIIQQKPKKVNNFYANLFDDIKNNLDIKYVLVIYGVQFNSKGVALCPFHSEKSPSFRIYEKTQSWYCFGCGAGGSVIDFVMKRFDLSGIDAAKRLNDDLNLNLLDNPAATSSISIDQIQEDKKLIVDFTEWEQSSFRAVANCFRILKWRGEMLFVHGIKYFEQYLPEIEQINFVENLLDTMIDNTHNFEAQVNFTANTERWWI